MSSANNKAQQAQVNFDTLIADSFAKQQDAIIKKRGSVFEANKKFNEKVSSGKAASSPFAPQSTGSSNTSDAVKSVNSSISTNSKTQANKKAIAGKRAAEADSARRQFTPEIKQAALPQSVNLFNLGF